MGKEHSKQAKYGALLMGLCCILSLLFACTPQEETVFMPDPTATPAGTEAPQEIAQNPLLVYWDALEQVQAPVLEAMHAFVDAEVAYLGVALEVELHVQRLQQFFLSLTRLYASSDTVWEGILSAKPEGSGSILQGEDGCTFSCVLWSEGRITGTLQAGVLEGVWSYAEEVQVPVEDTALPQSEWESTLETIWTPVRAARIGTQEDTYYSYVDWGEDGASLLLLSGGEAYFSQGQLAWEDISFENTSWAQWYFDGQSFHALMQEAQPAQEPEAAQAPFMQGEQEEGV